MAKRKSKRYSIAKQSKRKFNGETYAFFAGYGKKSTAVNKKSELKNIGLKVRVVKHQSDDHPGYRYDLYTKRKTR
jgi:hypothetical protein